MSKNAKTATHAVASKRKSLARALPQQQRPTMEQSINSFFNRKLHGSKEVCHG